MADCEDDVLGNLLDSRARLEPSGVFLRHAGPPVYYLNDPSLNPHRRPLLNDVVSSSFAFHPQLHRCVGAVLAFTPYLNFQTQQAIRVLLVAAHPHVAFLRIPPVILPPPFIRPRSFRVLSLRGFVDKMRARQFAAPTVVPLTFFLPICVAVV